MNQKHKRIVYNLITSLGTQAVSVLLAFLIPRLFLVNFGSEIKGLLSTVTQIFAYLSLLEAGVGMATVQALYGPISRDDRGTINAVMAATRYYYRRTGIIYLTVVLLFAAAFSLFTEVSLPRSTVFLAVLLQGLPSVLSYLIQGSPKPIVLTGAQKPIGFDSTDSKINLTDAFRCAAEDMPGVSIVFNNQVIPGTRARKTRSKSFQAFSSINYPNLGILRDGVLLRYIRQECEAAPTFYDTLDTKVALMKLVPGADRAQADFLLERNDALIIESFGVGGLPEAGGFYDCVRQWMDAGRVIVLTTQVANEGSDLGVYHVGHALKNDLGVLEAYDMTTEAVTAKLMWILGQTHDRNEVERLFYTPIAKDILWPTE